MSKVWICKCRGTMASDVECGSLTIDPSCPHCGRKYSTFYPEEWPHENKPQNNTIFDRFMLWLGFTKRDIPQNRLYDDVLGQN